MTVIKINHPDKNIGVSKDEQKRLEETIKLLTSISYDYATVPESVFEASANNTYESNVSCNPSPSHPLTPPKNAADLIKRINNHLFPNGRTYSERGYDKGNAYYETFKETIPNLLKWADSCSLDPDKCGNDSGWVIQQIATKFYLQTYIGSDVFVSALVSKDKARIKDAFDTMLDHLKNDSSIFLNFFNPIALRINGLIDKFCQFKTRKLNPSDSGGLFGISPNVVILLCDSLSIMLPYSIIDMDLDEDEELVRTCLTLYATGYKPKLQLGNGSFFALKDLS